MQKPNLNLKWYIGFKLGGTLRAFQSDTEPARSEYGSTYFAVMGPFKTKRAAKWMETFGTGNPHCIHVDAVERMAKANPTGRG